MARAINRLTTKGIEALSEPGMHADGAGLYLRIDQTMNRRWVWVYFWRGKRREMGLGAEASISLKQARIAAGAARAKLAEGVDPIAARKVEAMGEVTFGKLAARVIADLEPGWRNPKSAAQWTASLETYAGRLWPKSLRDIDTADLVEVLSPIWQKLPETASRVRGRIERILDVAKIDGLRQGENPARWKGHLQLMLARQAKAQGHHAALPYEALPGFYARLSERQATAARALAFAILTAARTTEVREATWAEISGDVWTIPAERMKGNRAHSVPLTPAALSLLESVRPLRTGGDFIFPGDQRIEPLSRMAMAMLLRRMDVSVTVHGFRSTFRDWVGDCTEFPREIAEMALAHAVGDDTEQAYRRRKALAKRRLLMEAWSAYCLEGAGLNVVPIRA